MNVGYSFPAIGTVKLALVAFAFTFYDFNIESKLPFIGSYPGFTLNHLEKEHFEKANLL